jgi:hypothetical protein
MGDRMRIKIYSALFLLGFALYACTLNTNYDSSQSNTSRVASSPSLISEIDESLAKKGLPSNNPNQPPQPPAAQLSGLIDEPAASKSSTNTATLLQNIDAKLNKDGRNTSQLPPPPAISLPQNGSAGEESISTGKPMSEVLRSIDDALKNKKP